MVHVPRKLWYQKAGDTVRVIVAEDDLPRLSKAIIVLGEPGMGKTEVLARLAKAGGTASCTARKLTNTHDPARLLGNATTLIIDALDEVAANQEGAAVDRVVQKLDAVGTPPFVLSCRVADWQAATSTQTIKEMYGIDPLLVHLQPLERADQIAILADQVGLERAEELLAHFEAFDLDLLGNPQTLLMIARLSGNEPLPTTKGDLFEKAIDQLWCEHRAGRGATELARDAALDAAGAAFASLILTGNSAIVRHGAAHLGDGELAFAEVDSLANGDLARILGSRLFEGGEDSFTYWHRRIGEFLGARWLAKRADEPAKQRRLLHLFQSHGLVPASLRGLHAWLARDPKLAPAVIEADPLGVVEYGDADALTPEQARVLFDGLRQHFQAASEFRHWRHPRAHALVSERLRADANLVLGDQTAPFALRTLLLEQLDDRTTAEAYRTTLHRLLFDETGVFAIRRDAGTALMTLEDGGWPDWIEDLRRCGTGDSLRLAFELMTAVGLEYFSDEEIVAVIFAYEGLTISSVPRRDPVRPAGNLLRAEAAISAQRSGRLLDVFSHYAGELLPDHFDMEHHAPIGLAYELILRWLDCGDVDPLRLWSHLETYAERHFHHPDKEARLATWFQTNDDVRRRIQSHVLLSCSPTKICDAYAQLRRRSEGLIPTNEDVAILISEIPKTTQLDNHWWSLVSFVTGDEDKGRAPRDAAQRFVAIYPKLVRRIERLELRHQQPWEIEEAKRERRATAERMVQHAATRYEFMCHLEDVRAGAPLWITPLAEIFLDFSNKYRDIFPERRRLSELFGEEIAIAALSGFEAFYVGRLDHLCAKRLALAHATDRKETAWNVIVAALAHRVRTREAPFNGLTDERLLAGAFAVWHSYSETKEGYPDLHRHLEAELRQRGCLEQAVRLFVTPQLKHRRTVVEPLHYLMRSEADEALAVRLALDWMRLCADLQVNLEAELIDRVLHSARRGELGHIGDARRAMPLGDGRRRNWDAVQVFVDIGGAAARLGETVERELLWHLQARQQRRRSEERAPLWLSNEQLVWIVSSFRALWPYSGYPIGELWGFQNAWQATEYLNSLIARLGEDTSDEATRALEALRDMPADGYTDRIKTVLAEQRAKRVEQIYVPPKVADIGAIVDAGPPTTASDLQAVMLENLATAQGQLKSDDVSSYRDFYREDGRHKNEELCRNELIRMLRAIDGKLEYIPEHHVADDKRVDIVARVGRQPILPIEIKGTWHDKLWTAADEQLNHQYVEDWRAERGIYLVLWFGVGTRIATPPAGIAAPTTPEELRRALVATSRAARNGLVDVVVLDLTRPTAT